MAIFSKLSTKSARTADRLRVRSATATMIKAKVGPRLPHGATVVSGIKVSLAIATTLGLSVPYMQGISDAAKQIMACADAIKTNRKECKRITALAEELTTGLLAVTEGIEEEDLDDRARMDLAELEWRLETISRAMGEMRREGFVRRLLSTDDHAAQLVEHRQASPSGCHHKVPDHAAGIHEFGRLAHREETGDGPQHPTSPHEIRCPWNKRR